MAENFALPSPQQLAEICLEFNLTDEQARELEITICHAHLDLEGYYEKRIGRDDRKARMDRLRMFDQLIGKLITLVEKRPDLINEDLPFDAREAIAWCASSQLIAEATGEQVSYEGNRIAHKEKSVGLLHGAEIFAAQMRRIRVSIQIVLAEESTDPGGPEPNQPRRKLIRALADAAPAIIGRPATGTAGGTFEQLVAAVFRAVGLDNDDIGKAIERALYPKASRPKSRT